MDLTKNKRNRAVNYGHYVRFLERFMESDRLITRVPLPDQRHDYVYAAKSSLCGAIDRLGLNVKVRMRNLNLYLIKTDISED